MSGRNRGLLALVGVVLLGLATALGLAGFGRLPLAVPPTVLPAQAVDPGVAALLIVAAAGLLLAVLAVLWLVACWDRQGSTPVLKLHADPTDGTTTVTSGVVASAVTRQVAALPGVVTARTQLKGAAKTPAITVLVTIDDRADVTELLQRIQDEVAGGIAATLETTVDRLGVVVDIDRRRQNLPSVTI